MSSTTPVPPPPSGGVSRDTIIIIAVCCSIVAISLIAVCLRLLIPRILRKRKKRESEDKSLFHSTQSLANTENQFYYSGPVPPPREEFDESDSNVLPTISGRKEVTDLPHRSYKRISEEFLKSTAWVSRDRQIDTSPVEIPESISDNIPETTNLGEQPYPSDNMRSEYSRGDSSNFQRQRVSNVYTKSDFRRPPAARVQRYIQSEVIHEDAPPLVRPPANYRENTAVQRIITEDNSIYSAPAHPPRKVVAPRANKADGERRVMNSAERELRPLPYIRSPASESPRIAREENSESPTWMQHALMIVNPVSWREKDSTAVQNSSKGPNTHSNTNVGQRNAPQQLSANQLFLKEQYIAGASQDIGSDRQYGAGGRQYGDTDRQLEGNVRDARYVQSRQYIGAGTREFTRVSREPDQYGHYVQRPGPGTQSIYSLGKDAIRTPELREYVRNGRQRRDLRSRDGYDQSVSASGRGDYRSNTTVEYSHGGNTSSSALAPVPDDLAPTFLPEEYNIEKRAHNLTAEQLNRNLTSYLGSGAALKPLDMSERYRENWDNHFDPNHQRDGALSHHTHPSENRSLPPDLEMLRLNAPVQVGYIPVPQNLPQQKQDKKGKKKKGKSK